MPLKSAVNWQDPDLPTVGKFCHRLAAELFPICRSITGAGVRQTLARLQGELPEITIHAIPSGTRVFDWEIPDEWNIRAGYIESESGEKICDFAQNNLHIVGYSQPVDEWLTLEALQQHIFSLPDQPEAIPYVTSYYSRRWGFCMTERTRKSLPGGRYRAFIDSELSKGELNYGEAVLPGTSDREVLISTYVCHPSLANNELSGPVVALALALWLKAQDRRHTFRFVFVPETIGSIAFLDRNLAHLRSHVVAGFNVTCIGDERCYSFLPSRNGATLSDRAALHVLKYISPEFKRYTWLERGSDERQYCAPGVDLPMASIMRSKYGEYPEYHTSLDDLELVTPGGLAGGFHALRQAIHAIENNCVPRTLVLGEPQLGKRGLYPTLSTKESGKQVRAMMNLISCADGTATLLDIAERIGEPFHRLLLIAGTLEKAGVMAMTNTLVLDPNAYAGEVKGTGSSRSDH